MLVVDARVAGATTTSHPEDVLGHAMGGCALGIR